MQYAERINFSCEVCALYPLRTGYSMCYPIFRRENRINRKEQETISTNDLVMKVEKLKELEELLEEVKTEAESVRDEIKQEMLTQDTEELEAGQYIIRWTSVLTTRFDTTAFKKVLPDVYKAYTKQITSRRFSIA